MVIRGVFHSGADLEELRDSLEPEMGKLRKRLVAACSG
jgi:hypothetical protein